MGKTKGRLSAKDQKSNNSCDGTEDLDTKTSKKLTKLLRHRAEANGLSIQPDGYVPVAEILALKQFSHICLNDLIRISGTDAKQRFNITEDQAFIRANQGHTIDAVQDDALLRKLGLDDCKKFEVCVHGTYTPTIPAILKGGLRRMARLNVHFAAGLPGDSGIISGMRGSADVLVYIDLQRAIANGIPFYVSENNVILSPGITWEGIEGVVPHIYFSAVVDRLTQKCLLKS